MQLKQGSPHFIVHIECEHSILHFFSKEGMVIHMFNHCINDYKGSFFRIFYCNLQEILNLCIHSTFLGMDDHIQAINHIMIHKLNL